jgi:hypothetical protein
MRDYKLGAHILFDLGVRKVRLMTNNPDKVQALEDYGLVVVERVPIEVAPVTANRAYLITKRAKFGHLLSLVGEREDSGVRIRESGVGIKDSGFRSRDSAKRAARQKPGVMNRESGKRRK